MSTSTQVIISGDQDMPLYVARPDGDPRGAVVVIQEAFGVNGHIEDVTRRFAAEGYLAVAPHLFHRSGGGTVPYTDFAQAAPHLGALDDDLLLQDLDATLDYLSSAGIDAGRTAVVGFCVGGRIAFLAALHRRLGAAVSFYGGGIVTSQAANRPPLVASAATLQSPWLGIFGDGDASIPVEDVQALESAVGDARVATKVIRYPEAGHGFHCDARPSFHKASAEDAWSRTLEWLSAHIMVAGAAR